MHQSQSITSSWFPKGIEHVIVTDLLLDPFLILGPLIFGYQSTSNMVHKLSVASTSKMMTSYACYTSSKQSQMKTFGPAKLTIPYAKYPL